MSKSIASGLVGFTVAFLGVIIVAFLATSEWMSPFSPVRIVTIAVLLPAVIFGVLITMPGEGEEWTPQSIALGMGPGTFFGLAGMVVAGLWASPSTRVSAVEMFSDDKSKMVLALGDVDDTVSAAACAALLDVGPGGFRGQLMEEARTRPGMAARCLELSAQMPRGPAFATRLMGKWENDLLEGRVESSDTCALPDAVVGMSVPELEREKALLACFFRSQNSEMRKCCGANLGALIGTGSEYTTALATKSDMLVESQLLKDVVAVAFGTVAMDEAQKAEALKLGLGAEDSQKPIFEATCRGVEQMEQPSDVTKHLAASLDGRCEMDTTAIPRGRQAWGVICEETQKLMERSDLTVVEALCVGVEGEATYSAIRIARDLVEGAVEGKRKFGTMDRQIARGFAMQGDPEENKRKLEIERFVDGIMNDERLSPEAKQMMQNMEGGDTADVMAGNVFEKIERTVKQQGGDVEVSEKHRKMLEQAKKEAAKLP